MNNDPSNETQYDNFIKVANDVASNLKERYKDQWIDRGTYSYKRALFGDYLKGIEEIKAEGGKILYGGKKFNFKSTEFNFLYNTNTITIAIISRGKQIKYISYFRYENYGSLIA